MGEIDLLPQSEKKVTNKKPPHERGDVQYTAGEELKGDADHAVRMPRNTANGDVEPKKSGFFSWRRKKNEDPLSALAAKVVVRQQKSSSPPSKPAVKFFAPPIPAPRPMPTILPKTSTASNAASTFSETPRSARTDRAQVNLLPRDVPGAPLRSHHFRDLVLVALICAIFIGIADVGLVVYRRHIDADIVSVEADITRLDRAIQNFQAIENSARDVNNRLQVLRDVVDGHVYWTPLFQLLEERTLANVYYERMSGTVMNGVFTFQAVAPDFRTIETQVRALETSPSVKSVEVSTASASSISVPSDESEETPAPVSRVSFRMEVTFQPSLFKKILP